MGALVIKLEQVHVRLWTFKIFTLVPTEWLEKCCKVDSDVRYLNTRPLLKLMRGLASGSMEHDHYTNLKHLTWGQMIINLT